MNNIRLKDLIVFWVLSILLVFFIFLPSFVYPQSLDPSRIVRWQRDIAGVIHVWDMDNTHYIYLVEDIRPRTDCKSIRSTWNMTTLIDYDSMVEYDIDHKHPLFVKVCKRFDYEKMKCMEWKDVK